MSGLDDLSKALSAGYPDWSGMKVPTSGKALGVEDLIATMKAIKFDDGLFLSEPTFRFESKDGTIWAFDDESDQSFYRNENGKWSHGDRKRTSYVGPGSSNEQWLNNQLAQHVLKMTMEE